ncbi:MAG TPA: hypothetical protein VNS22_12990 [Geminicoccus sp.]|uniref:hypothetical protein n=1 Tax=Geminicoccus sp. TaxID=2024832 RepID=UPI002CB0C8EE|nr:hypothetical protein [Geminicoccus sp.]HWL69288.1 hypothetical protein [Geminicoccus sp.]
MAEAIQGTGQHGRLYWCIKTDLAPDGEIHVMADRVEVTSSGALIAWGSYRAHESEAGAEPSVNLVCAPGRWFAAYAASTIDGGGLAVQSWAGEVAHGHNRAADAERGHGLREVPHQSR